MTRASGRLSALGVRTATARLLCVSTIAVVVWMAGSHPAVAATGKAWSVSASRGCVGSSAACLPVGSIEGLAVAPDARSLYALSWTTEDGQQIYGIVGWPIQPSAIPDVEAPVACVAHPFRGLKRDGCALARGWPRTPQPSFSEWGSISVSPDGRQVYVAGFDSLTTFARDTSTGALAQMPGPSGCLVRDARGTPGCGLARGIRGAGQIAMSADGRNLYLTSVADRTAGVAMFARDPKTGSLAQLPGTRGCTNTGLTGCERGRQIADPRDIVVAPNDRHVYVVTSIYNRGGGIAAYERDPVDGFLRQLPGRRGCINTTGRHRCRKDPAMRGELRQLAVAPSGRALYTIKESDSEGPRSYRLLPDGSVGGSSTAAPWPNWFIGGDNPDGLAVDPEGRVYAAGHTDGFLAYRSDPSGLRLKRAACWVASSHSHCALSHAFGYPGGSVVVASPAGDTVYVNGERGVITVRTPPP